MIIASLPDAVEKQEPTKLLSSHVMDQGSVINLRSALKIAADESIQQPARADEIWFLDEPFHALQKHKEWMIA